MKKTRCMWTVGCSSATKEDERMPFAATCMDLEIITLSEVLEVVTEKYGRLHKFVCHPWAGAMLIFSVLFQLFNICATKANT